MQSIGCSTSSILVEMKLKRSSEQLLLREEESVKALETKLFIQCTGIEMAAGVLQMRCPCLPQADRTPSLQRMGMAATL